MVPAHRCGWSVQAAVVSRPPKTRNSSRPASPSCAGHGELQLEKGPLAKGTAGSAAESASPLPVSSSTSAQGWARGNAQPSAHAAGGGGSSSSSSNAGAGPLERTADSSSSAHARPGSAAAAQAATPPEEAAVEEQLQRLRLAAEQNGDVLQQLAAKYGCAGETGGGSSRCATSGSGAEIRRRRFLPTYCTARAPVSAAPSIGQNVSCS